MPIAFFLSERKFKRDHNYFISDLLETFPRLKKVKTYFVTDKEFSFQGVWPGNSEMLFLFNLLF